VRRAHRFLSGLTGVGRVPPARTHCASAIAVCVAVPGALPAFLPLAIPGCFVPATAVRDRRLRLVRRRHVRAARAIPAPGSAPHPVDCARSHGDRRSGGRLSRADALLHPSGSAVAPALRVREWQAAPHGPCHASLRYVAGLRHRRCRAWPGSGRQPRPMPVAVCAGGRGGR